MTLSESIRFDRTNFIKAKEPARQEIAAATEAFLAAGGEIQQIETGSGDYQNVSGPKLWSMQTDEKKKMLLAKRQENYIDGGVE